MYIIYSKETASQELTKWSQMFNMLSITKNLSIGKFEEIVQKYLTDYTLSDQIEELYEYETFNSFICKVFNEKSSQNNRIIHKKTKYSNEQDER